MLDLFLKSVYESSHPVWRDINRCSKTSNKPELQHRSYEVITQLTVRNSDLTEVFMRFTCLYFL